LVLAVRRRWGLVGWVAYARLRVARLQPAGRVDQGSLAVLCSPPMSVGGGPGGCSLTRWAACVVVVVAGRWGCRGRWCSRLCGCKGCPTHSQGGGPYRSCQRQHAAVRTRCCSAGLAERGRPFWCSCGACGRVWQLDLVPPGSWTWSRLAARVCPAWNSGFDLAWHLELSRASTGQAMLTACAVVRCRGCRWRCRGGT
jgi:hypothetical protein